MGLNQKFGIEFHMSNDDCIKLVKELLVFHDMKYHVTNYTLHKKIIIETTLIEAHNIIQFVKSIVKIFEDKE